VSILSTRLIVVAAAVAAAGAALGEGLAATSTASTRAHAASPPNRLAARRLRPRAGAVAPGVAVSSSALFGDRVFANAHDGFALANDGQAQYPALSADGGHSWRIDGPQLHVDAADGPEGVGYVGVAGPREFFAYGSSVVDVTSDGGRTWWETFLGELVMAVVSGPRNDLVAYVKQSVSTDHPNPAVTWQYVSRDAGRHWTYSTALSG
jgi:hypothetical protein